MNEIISSNTLLPDTIEDLSKFVLVNEEKIQALRAEIRAIKKVHLAKEVYEQKLAEAQEIGQITVEAAQKMGELLYQIQKQSGLRTDLRTSSNNVEEVKTKTEIITEMGMTKDQVSQYQQMAQNPEAVQAAIQKAIERGDVVSRSQVMKEINAIKEQLAKKDKKISELESREPQIKEVVKEVVPADYNKAKEDARIAKADFQSMQKAYEEMAEKWKAESLKNEQLRQKEQDPEIQYQRKVKLDAMGLCAGVSNFLEKYGGFTYFMGDLKMLTAMEKNGVISAVQAISRWADEMMNTTVSEVVEDE